MLAVRYNGIKVHVSFFEACVKWTVLRGFKEERTIPSGLYVHLHQARGWSTDLPRCSDYGTSTCITIDTGVVSGVADLVQF